MISVQLIDEQKSAHENRKVIMSDQILNSHHQREANHSQPNPTAGSDNPHSVVHVEDSSAFSRTDNQLPRRVFQDLDDPKDVSYDHDENKYKRKSALELFLR